MYNGIINVYKEAGFTSHDVVAKLRGILRQKKIGHTGTLDPDAVGVLPVCLGSGTRLCDMLTDWNKEYIAELRLGVTTEVNGKKLYELAREGKEVERKARTVEITELEILESSLPVVKMRVVCSKGTYIRTLCHDIGEKLGVGGAMQSLQRSRVGIFRMEDALTLSKLEELRDEDKITDVIIEPDAVFAEKQAVYVNELGEKFVKNGNQLTAAHLEKAGQFEQGEQVRVYDTGRNFCGIYEYRAGERKLWPVKMFLTKD